MGNDELWLVLRDNMGTPIEERALHEFGSVFRTDVYAGKDQGPFITPGQLIIPACEEERHLIGNPHAIITYDPSNPYLLKYNSRFSPGGKIQVASRRELVPTILSRVGIGTDKEKTFEQRLLGTARLDMSDLRVIDYTIPVGYHSIRLSRLPEATLLSETSPKNLEENLDDGWRLF
jgi:hypothetical protein